MTARHPQLACTVPNCFHFFRLPLTISSGTFLQVWGELLLNWPDSPRGLHLSACASDFWTCPQDPPQTEFAQKGCQSTGLELRIPLMYLKFCRSGPVNFWTGGPKNLDPPPAPPPLRFDPFIYQLTALEKRIPIMYFLIDLTQKLCLLAPPGIYVIFGREIT